MKKLSFIPVFFIFLFTACNSAEDVAPDKPANAYPNSFSSTAFVSCSGTAPSSTLTNAPATLNSFMNSCPTSFCNGTVTTTTGAWKEIEEWSTNPTFSSSDIQYFADYAENDALNGRQPACNGTITYYYEWKTAPGQAISTRTGLYYRIIYTCCTL